MESGIVIVDSDLVETQIHVEPGPHPFAASDGAGLERLHDFASRHSYHAGAQPSEDLPAEPRHSVAQTSERVWRGDFAGTPAAHLRTSIEAEKRLNVELPAECVPQLLTTAILHPREQFIRGEAERDSCEEIECRRLLFPIVIARVIHISDTGPDGVERFERANERPGREHPDVNTAVACGADPLRQTFRTGLKTRRPCGPCGHHLQLSQSLSDRRRRKAKG